ncbi:hypothetical protein D3C79_957140 [compost metagenome]
MQAEHAATDDKLAEVKAPADTESGVLAVQRVVAQAQWQRGAAEVVGRQLGQLYQ